MEDNKNSQIETEEQEIKTTSKKVTIFNFILIAVIFIGLLIYMFMVDGIDNVILVLQQVDYTWVCWGLLALLGLWFCDTMCLHIPLKKFYPAQKFTNSIKVNMIGQLFNNVTPFSSGGQPMQAYALTKTGKRASESMSILTMKFIVTQLALLLFTVIVVLWELPFFLNLFQDFLWVAILGFVANIVLVVVIVFAGIYPKLIIIITLPWVKLLAKLKIIKDFNKAKEKVTNSIIHFSNQFKFIFTQKQILLQIFIWATLQSLCYYAITYMVYRAFGNSGINYWQIIPAQAFLLMIMTITPTPGAGLGAEGGFLLIFQSIFKTGTINLAILFWRIYTFYLPIIVGALFLIPIKKSNFVKQEKK